MKATTEFDEITVFGARGHTLMVLLGMEEVWRGRVRIRALIDDLDHGFTHSGLNVPVISGADRLRLYPEVPVLLGVGSGALRARMAAQFSAEGATLATALCRGQMRVDPSAEFGPGTLCAPYTRVGPSVRIGAAGQILASVIAHDAEIGDNVTMGIESMTLGHVQIGDNVQISPRAVISSGTRQRPLRIGAGAEIGTGAVVLQDVAPNARMIGNPAVNVRDWVRMRRASRKP